MGAGLCTFALVGFCAVVTSVGAVEAKIKYLDALPSSEYLEALSRCWVPVSADSRGVTLSLANGGAGETKAFVAFAQFRDEGGNLIQPPYQGFSQSPRGAAYFYVSGGEAEAPVATTRSFTPPPGAATLQIELRPWKFRDRPRLASGLHVIEEKKAVGAPAHRPGVYLLPVSARTRAMTLSLANGGAGETKAFVAAVRFLGEDGSPIQPPYQGFSQSPRDAAYFYVSGGEAEVPVATTCSFTSPPGAAALQIELRPWKFRDRPRLASGPRMTEEEGPVGAPVDRPDVYLLPVSADSGGVTLSLANGGAGETKAFVAFVQFRDEGDSLILPPYQGFSQSPRGAAYFYVSGGEAEAPVATTRSFTPPPGAATLQIELRPWKFRDRPRLASGLHVIEEKKAVGAPAHRPGVYLLPVSARTRAMTLSLANGGAGETKAFVAAVRFLGEDGSLIRPPYEGFSESNKFAAFFYAKGGKADAPSTTTYPFAAPAGAAAMEVELHPWRFRQKAQLVAAPAPVSDEPRRRANESPHKGDRADALMTHGANRSVGSQIAECVENGRIKIIGIVGKGLRKKLKG